MWLNVYLSGWLVTTIGVLVAAIWFSDRHLSWFSLGLLSVLAGMLWPVMVAGVVQMIAIAMLAKWMRAMRARRSDPAPLDQGEEPVLS